MLYLHKINATEIRPDDKHAFFFVNHYYYYHYSLLLLFLLYNYLTRVPPVYGHLITARAANPVRILPI